MVLGAKNMAMREVQAGRRWEPAISLPKAIEKMNSKARGGVWLQAVVTI